MHFLSLPVLNESDNIAVLLDCLSKQSTSDFELVVCVNNYDFWWDDNDKIAQCFDNQKSIELLEAEKRFKVRIIDRSSKGKGWKLKKGGVGHARKTAMDHIASFANKDDLIVSIDADTFYPINFLTEIENTLKDKSLIGLSLPYFHKTNGENDELILRYEIYMRYYQLNMFRIKNPFAYTALGSAMVFPLWAYKKVGGLTPVMSGEDFYFLQKLSKSGKLGIWAETVAYPSPRFSERVNFGTGPALIKGSSGNWDSYPIYDYRLFDLVKQTYESFESLFIADIHTPMDEFLHNQFKTDDLWSPLRKNFKDEINFVNACKLKVDGLRILQFLKSRNQENPVNNSEMLKEFIATFLSENVETELQKMLLDFDFELADINVLKSIRNFLFEEEMKSRKLICHL
jgi:hypothetical protein